MLSPLKLTVINPQVSNIKYFHVTLNTKITNAEEKEISPQRWTSAAA